MTTYQQLKYRLSYLWNGIWMGFLWAPIKALNAFNKLADAIGDKFRHNSFSMVICCILLIPLVPILIIAFPIGLLAGIVRGIVNAITRKPAGDNRSNDVINSKIDALTNDELVNVTTKIIARYENQNTKFSSGSSQNMIVSMKGILNQNIGISRLRNLMKLFLNTDNQSTYRTTINGMILNTSTPETTARYQPYNHGKRLFNTMKEAIDSGRSPIRLRDNALLFAQERRTRRNSSSTQLGHLPADVLKLILKHTDEAQNMHDDSSNRIINTAFQRFNAPRRN